jgi:hypothetical protein
MSPLLDRNEPVPISRPPGSSPFPERSRLTGRDLAVILVMLAAWVVFFAVKGTVGPGYHLMDDHEILRLAAELRHGSTLEVARSWVTADLATRFRPLYVVHRVAEARVFADDLRSWGLYTTALGAVTFVLLYVALRWLHFPPLGSLAFAFFGLCGPQAAIWWRLGPNETVGMACLALACVGLARWSLTGSWAWRLVLWAGAVLASLSKESFVAMLPALLLAAVWAVVVQRRTTWRAALAACVPEAALLGALLVLESAAILFAVGTDRIGYAGVEGVGLRAVLVAAAKLVGWPEVLALAGLGAVVLLGTPRARRSPRDPIAGLALACLAVGGQAFVYAKSGLSERYLVPGALAVALLLACLVRGAAGPEQVAPSASRGGAPWWRLDRRRLLGALSLAALVPLGAVRMRPMVTDSVIYARDGVETQAFLDAVTRLPDDARVVVAGGMAGVGEGFWSVHWYLALRGGRKQVSYLLLEPPATLDSFHGQLLERFRVDPLFPKFHPERGAGQPDAIAVLRGEEAQFLRESAAWFDPAAYARVALPGTFALFTRKPRG